MTAIIMAIQSFKEILRGKTVLIRSDNTTSVACITKCRTSSSALNELVIFLVEILQQLSLTITAVHIPGSHNDIADHLSRFQETGDWATNPRVFEMLNSQWGPHTIDRFASAINHKVQRYNSAVPDPFAEQVDAFQAGTWRWNRTGQKEFNYWNPPFHLLADTIDKIITDRAEGTLIAPVWKQHNWFLVLNEIAIDSINLSRIPDLFLPGLYGNSRTVGPPPWQVCAWKILWKE
jgi:hypothetical protein